MKLDALIRDLNSSAAMPGSKAVYFIGIGGIGSKLS